MKQLVIAWQMACKGKSSEFSVSGLLPYPATPQCYELIQHVLETQRRVSVRSAWGGAIPLVPEKKKNGSFPLNFFLIFLGVASPPPTSPAVTGFEKNIFSFPSLATKPKRNCNIFPQNTANASQAITVRTADGTGDGTACRAGQRARTAPVRRDGTLHGQGPRRTVRDEQERHGDAQRGRPAAACPRDVVPCSSNRRAARRCLCARREARAAPHTARCTPCCREANKNAKRYFTLFPHTNLLNCFLQAFIER